MKRFAYLLLISFCLFGCSKDDPKGLSMNNDGIYTITNSSELEGFNAILEGDTTVRCILAYPDKKTISKSDVPSYVGSVYEIDLPECTSIEGWVFGDCGLLTSINLPKCTTIGDGAFWQCESLISADLPKCTSIGRHSFAHNYDNPNTLTAINLPECTTIGGVAFWYCDSLTSLLLLSMKSITTVPIGDTDEYGFPNDTFDKLNTEQVALTLNANGKEKDNIKEGNIWKDEVWKEIILK